MTIHNQPRPPLEMNILKTLNFRMQLNNDQQLHYHNYKKGYLGERKLANLLNKSLSSSPILLYDLLFEVNNTEFQIDCLLIFSNKIFLLEIKNYEGNFYFQNNNWYIVETKKEIRSPLQQLKRSELLLNEQLQKIECTIQIEPYIIFVNPEFTLYQSPINPHIIFPSQINQFIKKLNNEPSTLNSFHTNLATRLTNLHIKNSTYKRLPAYKYDHLKKGILCKHCSEFLATIVNVSFVCKNCGHREKVRPALLRCVKEYHLLFPTEKMTTNSIYEWSNKLVSKKAIRRTLQTYLSQKGNGKSIYYVFD